MAATQAREDFAYASHPSIFSLGFSLATRDLVTWELVKVNEARVLGYISLKKTLQDPPTF